MTEQMTLSAPRFNESTEKDASSSDNDDLGTKACCSKYSGRKDVIRKTTVRLFKKFICHRGHVLAQGKDSLSQSKLIFGDLRLESDPLSEDILPAILSIIDKRLGKKREGTTSNSRALASLLYTFLGNYKI